MIRTTSIGLLAFLVVTGLCACQRESPSGAADSKNAQPVGTLEQAAQETVEGIKTPMDKARSVEGTLEQSAGRSAKQMQEATP